MVKINLGVIKMNNRKKQTKNMLKRVISTGIFGGLLFISLGFFLYIFNFTEISPTSYFVRIWSKSGWAHHWFGDIIALLIGSIVSLVIALLYYLMFRKTYFYWMGVLLGSLMWAIIAFGIQPLFPHLPKITNLADDTSFTILFLLILYGTFISYSISFDYYENIQTEKLNNK